MNDLGTNIASKMSIFADDTKLCHRARNPRMTYRHYMKMGKQVAN